MSNDSAPFVPATAEGSGPFPPAPWRVFGTSAFFRLWVAQLVSSLGDWIGLLAIIVVAERVSGPGAIGFVLGARLVPGFFLAPLGGVLVDRWDRRYTMIVCDVGRGLVTAMIPFVNTVQGLIAISFILECLTLLWSPAKEASVPRLVPTEKLAAANSLSIAAAYGSFPIASLVFTLLASIASWLGAFGELTRLEVNQEKLALWFDATTFIVSACLIASLAGISRDPDRHDEVQWSRPFDDLVDGWRFIRSHRLVRGVMIGFAGGLIGSGALVPLGRGFAQRVLHAGNAGYGLMLTVLGTGGAIGVIVVSAAHSRLAGPRVFPIALTISGFGIFTAASVSTLGYSVGLVAITGFSAGIAYVSGVTLLQEQVADELRGRTFATLYTVIRLCLLLSLTFAPWLAGLLDSSSAKVFGVDRRADILGISMVFPGVRLVLWLGGLIVIAAGILAGAQVRPGQLPGEETA